MGLTADDLYVCINTITDGVLNT